MKKGLWGKCPTGPEVSMWQKCMWYDVNVTILQKTYWDVSSLAFLQGHWPFSPTNILGLSYIFYKAQSTMSLENLRANISFDSSILFFLFTLNYPSLYRITLPLRPYFLHPLKLFPIQKIENFANLPSVLKSNHGLLPDPSCHCHPWLSEALLAFSSSQHCPSSV